MTLLDFGIAMFLAGVAYAGLIAWGVARKYPISWMACFAAAVLAVVGLALMVIA